MNPKNNPLKDKSRRNFLNTGAIILGTSAIVGQFGCSPIQRTAFQFFDINEAPVIGLGKFKADFWLKILEDNTIQLSSPKVEMGQGVFTGAALMVAEELDTDPVFISVIHAKTSSGLIDPLGTGGSTSTAGLFKPVREAAATMRLALQKAAAKIWGVPETDITIKNSKAIYQKQKLKFSEIISQTSKWEIPKKSPKLKSHDSFKYIGKDTKRVDLKDKVLGKPIFAIDHHIEGMSYAVLVQSPFINGTRKTVDTIEAKAISGVEHIVEEKEFIAVIAKNRYAAEMAARKVKVEWNVQKKWNQKDLDELIQVGNGKFESIQKEGNVNKHFDDKIIEASYRTPAAAHAFMEPKGTIADYKNGKITIITGTQQPNGDRIEVAKALGIKKENVDIQCAFLGGGFGGRFYINQIIPAAKLSKKLKKPIHLLSTREHDFMNNYYRPGSHHVLKAKIENGRVVAAQHDMASDDMIFEYLPKIVQSLLGADPSSAHGALFNYSFENKHTNAYRVNTPYITGIWRGIGINATSFAKECFMDELAHSIDADPIEFRLKHLQDNKDERHERMRKIIELVKEKAEWKTGKVFIQKGSAKGFACAMDRQTVVAAIAEVEIIDKKVKVTKFTLGIDPGLIVNPEGVRQQCEGCIMMGLSNTLYENLTLKDGQVENTNFHKYPVAMLSDTPKIEIVLHSGSEEVFGVGEPPIAPIAPAITNAVFNLTGQRLRNLPLELT